MGFRQFIHRYGFVILGCVSSLMLSALFCLSSCDPTIECNEKKFVQVSDTGLAVIPKKTAFLVILVLSASTNMEQRDTIRQTWLKIEAEESIVHYFAVGTGHLDADEQRTLLSENNRFNDVLSLKDVKDSYRTLTSKLVASLVWINDHFDFRFLLKVDDDSFVQLDMLMNELLSVSNKANLYWGYFNGRAHVQKRGAWQENDWVLCDYYLPYALGGGYVISAEFVRFIAFNRNFLKLFKSEDVSMGTWLAPLNVDRVHDVRFNTAAVSRGCMNDYIVSHKQSTYEMRDKYWCLQEKGYMCRDEKKTSQSYIYNWKVPPSECCKRNDSILL